MTDEQWTDRIIAMEETLYRVSYSLLPLRACDREDAVQAAIEKAWQKRTALRDENALEKWMIRILINECRLLLRRRRREVVTDQPPEVAVPPEDIHWRAHDLLLSLPEKLRLPAVLHYMEDIEQKDVAAMLRLPLGTVKSRLFKARRLLRNQMEKEEAMEHADGRT